jgi:RNA-directed DNA polymerase
MNKSKAQTEQCPMTEWGTISWPRLDRRVFKLQKRIFKASSRGDVVAVRRLQKTLLSSWSAKCIAVRRVTQDNQGKKTAGVDGIKGLNAPQRIQLVKILKLSDKAKPTRRVWIPKPGKSEKRPLGIPTIRDRATQALVKLALEPEWEAKFEPNSYGFRPGRSAHDAIGQIYCDINQKAKYVLDADIAQCFDTINHTKLLEKVNTFPTLRRQLRAWLKSGVIDKHQWFPTEAGTPQGGVISPLLANIALHGLETLMQQVFPRRTPVIRDKEDPTQKKRQTIASPNIVRYADDFVVFHDDLGVIQKAQQVISQWLAELGLELKPSKTRVTHTLWEREGEKPGFNFLGFTIRQFPVGKYTTGKNTHGQPLGYKTVIHPSNELVKRHQETLKQTIHVHRGVNQETMIGNLNPLITGWARYVSTVASRSTCEHLDDYLFKRLWSWARSKHQGKTGKWVKRKYWQTYRESNWRFLKGSYRLKHHSDTPIIRHKKVRGDASPFDGNTLYWSQRRSNHPELHPTVAKLLQRQKGKCAWCGNNFWEEDTWEIDHKQPKSQGGRQNLSNLQVLHRHSHHRKSNHDKVFLTENHFVEEPDEMKVSRPVLKPSGEGNLLA